MLVVLAVSSSRTPRCSSADSCCLVLVEHSHERIPRHQQRPACIHLDENLIHFLSTTVTFTVYCLFLLRYSVALNSAYGSSLWDCSVGRTLSMKACTSGGAGLAVSVSGTSSSFLRARGIWSNSLVLPVASRQELAMMRHKQGVARLPGI